MKRLLAASLVFFAVGLFWVAPNPAPSATLGDYYRCSRDPAIIQALQILDTSSDRAAVNDIVNRNVKIVFKNMQELGKAYIHHDALSFLSADDHQIIYINMTHQTAPPPALAALISHEVLHNDRENSLAEEIYAWSREGKTWQELLTRYPQLKSIPTGQVPLMDRENAIVLLEEHQRLKDEIINNVAYQGLPPHSPGF